MHLYKCAIQRKVTALKSDGTVAMSADNLFAITCTDLTKIPHAPQGTNCGWVARQSFNEIIRASRALRNFTTI